MHPWTADRSGLNIHTYPYKDVTCRVRCRLRIDSSESIGTHLLVPRSGIESTMNRGMRDALRESGGSRILSAHSGTEFETGAAHAANNPGRNQPLPGRR